MVITGSTEPRFSLEVEPVRVRLVELSEVNDATDEGSTNDLTGECDGRDDGKRTGTGCSGWTGG
jgi:hypothetical protein